MFVEALAEGRGVSLPAGALGAARTISSAVGAYTRVRKQFKVPIAEFGGIQEALARAGRESYTVIAGVELMNAIVDNHEAPMVLSSIMKQSCTDRGRTVVQDGMDILGGAGICRGNMNFLGNMYMSMPVAITVEGANIMTRSFQIIGQGLTRCHPHILPLIYALQDKANPESPAIFMKQALKVFGHVGANFGLSITRGLSSTLSTALRSPHAYKDSEKLLAYHEAQLLRLSANFAFTADLALGLARSGRGGAAHAHSFDTLRCRLPHPTSKAAQRAIAGKWLLFIGASTLLPAVSAATSTCGCLGRPSWSSTPSRRYSLSAIPPVRSSSAEPTRPPLSCS